MRPADRLLTRLGLRPLREFTTEGDWYAWLVNEYIPTQGRKDMDVFISLGFDAAQYVLWKWLASGKAPDGVFTTELRRRFRDVYGICDRTPDGRCEEMLWRKRKGVDPETGKAYLTRRMHGIASRLAAHWRKEEQT